MYNTSSLLAVLVSIVSSALFIVLAIQASLLWTLVATLLYLVSLAIHTPSKEDLHG